MYRTIDISAFALSKLGWGVGEIRGAQTILRAEGLSLWDYPSWEFLHREQGNYKQIPSDEKMKFLRGDSVPAKPRSVDVSTLVELELPIKPVLTVPRGSITGTALHKELKIDGRINLAPHLRQVSPEWRGPLVLRYVLNMELREIATYLGRREELVQSQILQGIESVRTSCAKRKEK